MKRFSICLLTSLIGSLSFGQFDARADLEVSASVQIRAVADFHAPLTPHGAWIEVGTYGRCWRPSRVAVGWQPYCYGRWVWTDCGWYWASDEPWAWACYHYGTWVHDPFHGWVWVPGIEWAPAWVYWRVGGGYCGWAPCAPRGVVVAPRTFVFVQASRFHEPVKPSSVIINNTTIISQTAEVGSLKRETRNLGGGVAQQVVVNEGPEVEAIRKATGKAVVSVPIREAVGGNPIPSEAVTKIEESRKNEKQPAPEKKVPQTEPKTENKKVPQPPPPVSPPGKDKQPDRVTPKPQNPPAPDKPSGKPAKPPGKGKQKDNGKGEV